MKFNIQLKLFLFSLVVGLIPFLVFGIIVVNNQSKLFEQEISASNEREISQFAERLEQELTKISTASNLIYTDKGLRIDSEAYASASGDLREAYADSIIQRLQSYSPIWNTIYPDAMILARDGSMIGLSPYQYYFKEYFTENPDEYDQLCSTLYGTWKIFRIPSSGSTYIVFARSLSRSVGSSADLLILCFPTSEIYKLFSNSKTTYRSIFLLNEQDELITCADDISIGTSLDFLPKQELQKFSGFYKYKAENGENMVFHRSFTYPVWRIVIVTDMDLSLPSFYSAYYIYLIASGIYLVILFIMSFLCSRTVTMPIKHLYSKMKLVEAGNLVIRAEEHSKDEIGLLAKQYNKMLDKIQLLMDDIIKEQELKRKSDLTALQTQINPHFLYNTLANIRYMILIGERKSADAMVLSLTKLLKNILSNSNNFVSVQMELDQLRDYILLQQHMLSDSFTYSITADPDVLNCISIKLMLQPIVENAMLHGLRNIEQPSLSVTCTAEGNDTILFSVTDNGSGFNSIILQEQLNSESSENSIGIFNVNNRIKLNFGSEYGIVIKSAPGCGTTVLLRIPKILYNKEDGLYEYINS